MFTWRVAEPRAASSQQPARCMERDEQGAARSRTHSPPARREGRGEGWPRELRCLGDRQAAGWLLYLVMDPTEPGGPEETHPQHRGLQTGPRPPLRGSGRSGSSCWLLSSTLL